MNRFLPACALLVALPLAGCGSAVSSGSSSPGFTGYDWQVVVIGHDGMATSIPARVRVTVQFSPDGQFGASDGVNFHSGTYRATGDGFTTTGVGTTFVAYAGHDPAVLLAIGAIGSFDGAASATTTMTGDRLVVGVGSYTLTCQRSGPQADLPAPQGTRP